MPNPESTQHYNRYMFVAGNPVSFMDVCGYDEETGGTQGTTESTTGNGNKTDSNGVFHQNDDDDDNSSSNNSSNSNPVAEAIGKVLGGIAGGIVGGGLGAGSGAAIGAAIGSIIPGAGTAAGAAIGAVIGGISGGINGAAGIASGAYGKGDAGKFISDNTIGIGFSTPYVFGESMDKINGTTSATPGATIIELSFKMNASFSPGFIPFIFTGKGNKSNPFLKAHFQHEYGHCLQYRELGGAVGMGISVTSLLSFQSSQFNDPSNSSHKDHDDQPFEIDANKRAANYFGSESAIATSDYYNKKQRWE